MSYSYKAPAHLSLVITLFFVKQSGVSAFGCNVKSFAIVILVFTPFSYRRFFDGLPKVFLRTFHDRLLGKCVGQGFVTDVFGDVICNVCDLCYTMCFTLFRVTNIQSIRKLWNINHQSRLNSKNQSGQWHRRFKSSRLKRWRNRLD